MDAKGMVLLVEDNAELNANNTRALKMLEYEVHPALTLAEARSWLATNEADVILLDVMLPDGDGIDFCTEIRGEPLCTTAHILFLTAKTGHEDRVRALADGGDDYITKPFHPEELLARVQAAMRRRNMQRTKDEQQHTETAVTTMSETQKLHAFAAFYRLTEKESAVLLHIIQSMNTKAMAKSMGISVKGIEFHISHILHKTGIKKRRDVLRVFANWMI
ncbi:response regulator [Desulfovibrio litoralis]|uniref:DNA-binding response regulator, OmpR family, contains REC and winged-helix (WHTH) domain n=1 Tax=Desulfovibrio litoralis DSM 11393 TaxID=1121455 RepID=A0A1M7T0Y5_9BACT|nr:response regulator [Desulfovibrio litoralis]SHN64435.1 DNA-binding response regulator, OmpR family, contains REC and winged-helix (wHTH) domain [Desulfovibrio litoralis DSM 11393]